MKAYKRELSHFFSNKKEQDIKLKKSLADKSFEEKKEIIAQYRETAKLDQGVYSIDEHQFERKQCMRDIHYLEIVKQDIRNKYLEFNKYKYDALYDLIEVDEARFDQYEAEIAQLKKNRDNYISNKAEKKDQLKSFNDENEFNIRQQVDAFNAAEKEDKKEIYRNIILLKKARFEKIEPHLSMLTIDKLHTLVTDYVPIKGNQKRIMFNLGGEENVSPEILEEPELPVIQEKVTEVETVDSADSNDESKNTPTSNENNYRKFFKR